MIKQKITYSQVGDHYETKNPIKKLAQSAARETAANLTKQGFQEVSDSRGESAYVWQQGDVYMASVIEGLGTKNLIADETRKITGKTYYDIIGHDTVATIINDLTSVGAAPLVVHAYWAIEDNAWLQDEARMKDLIEGWKDACNAAGASWGGGETATMKQIVIPGTSELGGSAVGIVQDKSRLLGDSKLKEGDAIVFLKSNGINANGVSLARAIAAQLEDGYATRLPSGMLYGEALLTRTNIYAKLIESILDENIDLHYVSNITGHGLRKVMRAKQSFTYLIEQIFEPQEVFSFMQEQANLSDQEAYATFNMGQDYALFVGPNDAERLQNIIKKNGFESILAGRVEKGERQVVIKQKNITYRGETLDLR